MCVGESGGFVSVVKGNQLCVWASQAILSLLCYLILRQEPTCRLLLLPRSVVVTRILLKR